MKRRGVARRTTYGSSKTCSACGGLGHTRANKRCPNYDRRTIHCSYCKKEGHTVRTCNFIMDKQMEGIRKLMEEDPIVDEEILLENQKLMRLLPTEEDKDNFFELQRRFPKITEKEWMS
eukprot:TRINITY_DN7783_c1_g1_i1.p1 TRINITY_DN7783_c1_g1~~TRINITY_DN7783_c1_g1_i1.p1  ORF type:complete len:119 (-),score=13.41 TRINITY_DN7783_c1_g1_i1:469-825(-)